jgi:hypothetical protein
MRSGWLLLTLSLFSVPLTTSAADIPAGAFAGTWKFNLAKCKFPGPPPQVDMFTMDPDGRVTVHEISADGKNSTWTYKPQAGQAVAVEGRGPNVTVIASKVNAHRTEQIWNFNGRAAKSWAILSEDGKTQTFHMEGTDKDGKPFQELVVYEKQ